MKTSFVSFSLLACLTTANAQTGKEWDDPSISHVNREKAHTTALPMQSEADAVKNDRTLSPFYQSLDGIWKFQWVNSPTKATAAVCAKDYNDAAWTDIDVPSSWQVWGLHHNKSWDKPLYCNVAYPFSFNEQTYSVMAERPGWFTYNSNMPNPVGTYRRHFNVTANMLAEHDVYVRFNGVGHGFYLWVNGQRIGYSEDSYVPAEFNITDYLMEGDNVMALQVYRFTSGSFLECQDYWRLTGIQRHCFIWAAPKTQIRDFFFTTDLDNSYTNAKANVKVWASPNPSEGGTNLMVEAKILDNGTIIATSSATITTGNQTSPPSEGLGEVSVSLDMNVTAPKLWSAETPNLYDLVLTLKDADGNVRDIRASKVGFKEVSIRNDGALLINGKRMVFHGVNRHDFSPVNGRAITDEEIEEDIKTMKRLNVNAVRTSHYPNDPVFYDLCDKYGLYVLAEADVECHAHQKLSSLELFRPAMVERSENHVLTMRNHPCIFMWSFGNESGGGENFRYVQQAIKALDKTRLTHYEGGSQYADVSSSMYGGYDYINMIGSSQHDRPHIQCENSHSMGNSMGNVRDMFDLYEKYPCLTGEFIWDFKDQGLLTKTSAGKEYWAYGGDFNDNPNDGNFCINGLVRPDWSLTSKSYNTKKVYQPLEFKAITPPSQGGAGVGSAAQGRFRIKNKMAFLPSTVYDVKYELMDEEGNVLASGIIDKEVAAADSTVITLDLSPLTSQSSPLTSDPSPLTSHPSPLTSDQEAFIHFTASLPSLGEGAGVGSSWADAGYVVAEEKLPVQTAQKPMYDLSHLNAAEDLTVSESSANIIVQNSTFKAVFSKTKGTLSTYTYDGTAMVSQPLQLSVFRLPTDNDGSKTSTWDTMGLRKLSVKGTGAEIQAADDKKTVSVALTSTYTGQNGTAFDVLLDFVVCADGTLMVNSVIRPASTGAIIPKMGFRLEMPKEMEQLSWFGRGPWDSYRDRKEACLPGIYTSTVTDQREDYILPQEHGTKQEVRWMSLSNDEGKGLLFVAPDQMAASAVHFRPEDNYTDRNNRMKHTYQFKACSNTIVSLDAATRGLGNNSCGPDVRDRYELRTQNTAFRFFIIPFSLPSLGEGVGVGSLARVEMPVCQPVTCERQNNGRIKMSTSTQNAIIYYSIDGGEYQQYTAALTHNGACTIRTYCTADGLLASPVMSYSFDLYVSKSAWKVVSADSYQGGNEAKYAIDGNNSTFWHTQWTPTEPQCPHTLIVDMGTPYKVTAFTYLARQDGNENGMVKAYEIYLSDDGKTWGTAVATGEFKKTSSLQEAKLRTPKVGRYWKFVAKSEINGRAWTSAAEIGIQAEEENTGIGATLMNNEQCTMSDDSVFNLQGRRMTGDEASWPHGIYIFRGRKVLR